MVFCIFVHIIYSLVPDYTRFYVVIQIYWGTYLLTYLVCLDINSLRTRGLLIKVNYLNTIVPKMTRLLKIAKIFSRIACM